MITRLSRMGFLNIVDLKISSRIILGSIQYIGLSQYGLNLELANWKTYLLSLRIFKKKLFNIWYNY